MRGFFSLAVDVLGGARYTQTLLFSLADMTHLTLLGSGGTGDNLDELACDDGLARAVEQNLEAVDHVAGVWWGGRISTELKKSVIGASRQHVIEMRDRDICETVNVLFEALSMALRRADCSQAWPSAKAQ